MKVRESKGLKSQAFRGNFTSHPLNPGLSNTNQQSRLSTVYTFKQYFQLLLSLSQFKAPEAPYHEADSPCPDLGHDSQPLLSLSSYIGEGVLVFHAGVEGGGVYLGPKLPGEIGAREASDI